MKHFTHALDDIGSPVSVTWDRALELVHRKQARFIRDEFGFPYEIEIYRGTHGTKIRYYVHVYLEELGQPVFEELWA